VYLSQSLYGFRSKPDVSKLNPENNRLPYVLSESSASILLVSFIFSHGLSVGMYLAPVCQFTGLFMPALAQPLTLLSNFTPAF
jgi:hypothetical protein